MCKVLQPIVVVVVIVGVCVCVCVCLCVCVFVCECETVIEFATKVTQLIVEAFENTHTHIYIYIYTYVYLYTSHHSKPYIYADNNAHIHN